MKSLTIMLLSLLFLCGVAAQNSSGTFTYTFTTDMDPYTDLTDAVSLNNGEVWEDPDYAFVLPFPFILNGNEITALQFEGFGSALSGETGNPDILSLIYHFEADLVDRGHLSGISMSPISLKVEGSIGSRILKIELKNAGSYREMVFEGTLNMFINTQLWLYEGSNKIEMRFGPSFINDPGLFYGNLPGAYVGITDYYGAEDLLINPHMLIGPADSPSLTTILYTITGTPENGTVYRFTIDVPLAIQASGTNATSYCAPNGTATVDVTGGVGPYTFVWSNNETTQTINNLDAGTYIVTVTDNNGSTATDSVAITNVAVMLINIGSTNETAVGANDGTAFVSPTGGLPPYVYLWSTGATTSVITGLAPGIYTVTVTDAAGCSVVESVAVDPFGCPELTVESSITNPACFGDCDGTIQITNVVNGTAPFTYSWQDGNTTATQTGLCAGEYIVSITDASGCNVSWAFTITQPEELDANAGSTNETLPDANDGTAWALPTGGTLPYIYLWSTGSTASMISGLPPGTYSVTVTDANLCSSSQTVTVDPFACSLGNAQISFVSCNGLCDGTIAVTINNTIAPVIYSWSNGATSPSIEDLCAGDYTLTTTDAAGCNLVLTFVVTEPLPLLANVGATNESVPGGNNGTAWATPTGGTSPYTYLWSNGATDSLIVGLTPGEYSITVTDSHGCTDSQTIVINAFQCVEITSVTATNTSCSDICEGALIVNAAGQEPLLFQWSNGENSAAIDSLCAGIYTVTITAANCINDPITFEITEPDPLNVVVVTVHKTDSTASSVSASANGGTQPYTYAWSGPNGFMSNQQELMDIGPGLYSLSITDANGCTVVQDSIEVRDETVSVSPVEEFYAQLFPNPAAKEVFINIADHAALKIYLVAIDGRILKSWRSVNKIDIRGIPDGLYFVRLELNGRYSNQKLAIKK